MAFPALFPALLDANALWSAAFRDTVLRAAKRDMFRPLWTEQILDELARNLKAKRPDLDPARLDRTIALMRSQFPEALVTGYEALIPAMTNHPGDRHVLAAAVRANASVIVTWNVKDFSEAARAPYDIDLQTPDTFLSHLWHLAPDHIVSVLKEQAAPLTKPPMTPLQVLDTLAKTLPDFADLARNSGRF